MMLLLNITTNKYDIFVKLLFAYDISINFIYRLLKFLNKLKKFAKI